MAPSPAGKLVTRGAGGTVTLIGSGGGVSHSSDNCTFAGSAFTASRGEFVCRLVSVVQTKAGNVAPGVKVGLMARASLSDNAAAVAVAFSTNRGVHAWGRAVDGLAIGDERPASPDAPTGLVGVSVLQSGQPPAVGANWLTKPLWLRLVLDVNRWTPYTSWDGKTWTAAGIPQVVEFAGAWVGVFAGNRWGGAPLQAVSDHLRGFSPDTAVQIGIAG